MLLICIYYDLEEYEFINHVKFLPIKVSLRDTLIVVVLWDHSVCALRMRLGWFQEAFPSISENNRNGRKSFLGPAKPPPHRTNMLHVSAEQRLTKLKVNLAIHTTTACVFSSS